MSILKPTSALTNLKEGSLFSNKHSLIIVVKGNEKAESNLNCYPLMFQFSSLHGDEQYIESDLSQ